jgi:transporter family protein
MPLWIIFALGSAIAAALVAIFGKIGLSKIDTTLATTLRSIVMAVLLIGISLALGKFSGFGTVHRKDALYIILAGVAGAISWLCYFVALRLGPTSGVVALDRLSVVIVLILAVLLLGEQLTWKSGLGAMLVAVGAVLMSWR